MSKRDKKNRRSRTEWLEHDSKKETAERKFIRRQLIDSQGNICAICGKPITNMKDCTIDHIKPISKGGLTVVDNCQLAHRLCNLRKSNKWRENE